MFVHFYDSHFVSIYNMLVLTCAHCTKFSILSVILTSLSKIFVTSTPTKLHVLRYVPRRECEISAMMINLFPPCPRWPCSHLQVPPYHFHHWGHRGQDPRLVVYWWSLLFCLQWVWPAFIRLAPRGGRWHCRWHSSPHTVRTTFLRTSLSSCVGCQGCCHKPTPNLLLRSSWDVVYVSYQTEPYFSVVLLLLSFVHVLDLQAFFRVTVFDPLIILPGSSRFPMVLLPMRRSSSL